MARLKTACLRTARVGAEMRKLRLVGLSPDCQDVVFVDDAGQEFAAPADDRLRAALRGDRARLGQLEIEMESALRPRDIQARIRAGEAPEAVAALAGVPVEKIMPYSVPVIAERQHVAELAGRSHVRRKNADSPSRRLHDVVAERLRGRGVDPANTHWDAWRRDDGRWIVQATYHSGESERVASFVFDSVGRYSLAEDDEAKWLTGESQHTSKGPQPREAAKPMGRRLAAVPATEDLLTLTEAELDDVSEVSDDLTAVIRAVREIGAQPTDEEDDSAGDKPRPTGDGDVDNDGGHDDGDVDDGEIAPPVSKADVSTPTDDSAREDPVIEAASDRRRKAGRRVSVPSWDEIMLGRRGER
jgi:hypothetical protein